MTSPQDKSPHQHERWSLMTMLKHFFRGEAAHLLTVNKSRRPWHMPLITAITISFPVFVGVYFGALSAGIKASLGAMIILNLPLVGNLGHRLVTVMAWGFGMVLCFALGLIAQQLPILRLPLVVVLTFGLCMFGRYYRQPPPAGLFVLMAGTIALFIPMPLTQVMPAVGLMMLGSGFALLMALLYSVFLLLSQPSAPAPECRYEPETIIESLMITFFVSVAMAVALILEMPNPYWVMVSCFIIVQGIHLRTIWIKQLHRMLGTLAGTFLAAQLLSWDVSPWTVALLILLMMVFIESWIDRHYGLAVVMITPLTIFIAEYGIGSAFSAADSHKVIHLRLIDTALGCLIGLGGGMVMHTLAIRPPLRRIENWLLAKFRHLS